MKRITALILALAMLITANCVLAESAGDAGSSPTEFVSYILGDSGSRSSRSYNSEEYIRVEEEDGRYIRYTVYLDEEARRLFDEYNSGQSEPKVTWEEFTAYAGTLPVSVTEELDVVPPTQEELDALAGKTVGEIRDALSAPEGMYHCYPAGKIEAGENIVLKMECGFFRYAVLVDDPYEEYLACSEAGSYDSLTAKSIARTGIAYGATNIYWVSEGIRKAWENAGSKGVPPFKTMREIRGFRSRGWFSESAVRTIIATEIDGRFFRYIALMDEEGKKLYKDCYAEGIDDAARGEAFSRFYRYRDMMPITRAEELTAVPLTQEELDALAGKALGELQDALSAGDEGYVYYPMIPLTAENREEEVTFCLEKGFFTYKVTVNETYEECLACQETGDYSDYGTLTVRSAEFDGLSGNSTDLLFHTDGTREPDRWVKIEVYNRTGETVTGVETSSADGSSRSSFSYPEAESMGQETYPIVDLTTNITLCPLDLIRWTTESGSTFEVPVSLEEGKYIILLLPEADGLIEIRADGPVDRIAD